MTLNTGDILMPISLCFHQCNVALFMLYTYVFMYFVSFCVKSKDALRSSRKKKKKNIIQQARSVGIAKKFGVLTFPGGHVENCVSSNPKNPCYYLLLFWQPSSVY